MADRNAALSVARKQALGVTIESAELANQPIDILIEDGEIYVVHGFIKKTRKVPDEDIALAARRMKETKE
jgi:hypothetical protein